MDNFIYLSLRIIFFSLILFVLPNLKSQVHAEESTFKPGQKWEYKDTNGETCNLYIIDQKSILGKNIYFFRSGNNFTYYDIHAVNEEKLKDRIINKISEGDIKSLPFLENFLMDANKLSEFILKECKNNSLNCPLLNLIDHCESYIFSRHVTSKWQANRKIFYEDNLKKNYYDLLIVPIQAVSYSGTIDKTGRALITREIAEWIGSNSEYRTPDLDLVYDYFGKGVREIEEDDLLKLAATLNVKKVLVGYIRLDHNNPRGTASLILNLYEKNGADTSHYTRKTGLLLDNISTTNEIPEFESFKSYKDKVLDFIGAKRATKSIYKAGKPENLELPNSIEEVIKASSSSLFQASINLQFLATLYPSYLATNDKSYYERSFLALDNVAKEMPNLNFIKARALYYLDRRPAALEVLKAPQTPEEKVFVEFLNGNIDRMLETIGQIKSPLFKYFAYLDLNLLNLQYNHDDKYKLVDKIKFNNKEFSDLIAQEYINEYWDGMSFETFKRLLDNHYPFKKYTTDDLLKLNQIQGQFEISDLQYIEYILEHLNAAEKNLLNEQETNNRYGLVTKLDYLHLLRTVFEDEIDNKALFYTQHLAIHERAKSFIDALENLMPDNPNLQSSKSLIYYNLALTEGQGEMRNNHLIEAFNTALKSILWSGGQCETTRTDINIMRDIIQNYYKDIGQHINVMNPYMTEINDVYLYDFPKREYWDSKQQFYLRAPSLDYTISEITYLKDAAERYGNNNKNYIKELLNKNKDRFIGHPSRDEIFASLNSLLGEEYAQNPPEGKVRPLSNKEKSELLIKSGGDSEKDYLDLAREFIRNNDYKSAYDLLINHPYIKIPKDDQRIGAANLTNDFGNLFFWRGEINDAIEFYQMSSGYGTGAEGELISQARIYLTGNQLNEAALTFLQDAKRYNNEYSYKDYISLLFAFNQGEAAWLLFDDVYNRFKNDRGIGIDLLESAFVGHRINNTDDNTVENWIKKRVAGPHEANDLYTFAVRYFLTDRNDYKNLPALIMEIDKLGFGGANKDAIENEGLYFTAYRLAREGKFNEAYKLFSTIEHKNKRYLEHIECWSSFILPYYIFSGYKTGNQEHLVKSGFSEQEINNCPPAKVSNEINNAFKSVMTADKDQSITHLVNAFNNLSQIGAQKQDEWYQLIEAAEFIFLQTKDARFKELLLKWAKKYQKIRPMYGWAYAFEALYTDDEENRTEALAYALYLDKNSMRLKNFSKAQKNKALKWLNSHNKFIQNTENIKTDKPI